MIEESGLSDGLIKIIIGGISGVLGMLGGNLISYKTNANKQTTEDFNVITDKWEKIYDQLEKHNELLEERLIDLEGKVITLLKLNKIQEVEIEVLMQVNKECNEKK
tara:strand:- start:74384 stop:74701 length:318 start_codon:yes stop_codon:yes gene_type:complete